MEEKLNIEEKKKIFDYLVPYIKTGKVKKSDVERLLNVEDDPYQRIELGFYSELQNSELHNQIRKDYEEKY